MPWFAGVPREEINWSPTIDEDKCVGCGMCMNCGKKVFEWRDGRPVVVNPTACVVGCSTCSNLCLGTAITFPPLEQLRAFYRQRKVWPAVKRALIAGGVIPEGRGPSADGEK